MTKTVNDYAAEGLKAFNQGLPIEANPYLFNAWPKQSYDLGWHIGRLKKQSLEEPQLEGYAVAPKSPYDQGRVGFAKGYDIMDGPYEPFSTDAVQYMEGWADAFKAKVAIASEQKGKPTDSPGLYVQMYGRATRPAPDPDEDTREGAFALIRQAIGWGLVVALMGLLLWAVLSSPSARSSGYKPCVSAARNVWVDCPDSGPITGVMAGEVNAND